MALLASNSYCSDKYSVIRVIEVTRADYREKGMTEIDHGMSRRIACCLAGWSVCLCVWYLCLCVYNCACWCVHVRVYMYVHSCVCVCVCMSVCVARTLSAVITTSQTRHDTLRNSGINLAAFADLVTSWKAIASYTKISTQRKVQTTGFETSVVRRRYFPIRTLDVISSLMASFVLMMLINVSNNNYCDPEMFYSGDTHAGRIVSFKQLDIYTAYMLMLPWLAHWPYKKHIC